jgi:hypothetical protein
MALICPQCKADNPAGNAFCMSCGAQLGAAVAAPAATPAVTPVVPFADAPTETFTMTPEGPVADSEVARAASPVAQPPLAATPPPVDPSQPGFGVPASYLPPGYVPGASPYLPAPPAGSSPVHRMSSTMIIAAVVIVLLIVGGGGVAFAALRNGGTTAPVSGTVPVHIPTTTPATTPTQPPATTPVPTPATPSGGKSLATQFASVFVPTGYTVRDQESDYVALTPNNGDQEAIGVQAEPLPGPTTNAELDQELLTNDQENGDPSASFCNSKAPSQTQLVGSGGPITADVIAICENVTPPNSPAFAGVDSYIDGVAIASDGSFKSVLFEILAPATSFQTFVNSIPSSLFNQTTFTDAGPPS